MARKKFYLDRWLQSMKIGTKVTLKRHKKLENLFFNYQPLDMNRKKCEKLRKLSRKHSSSSIIQDLRFSSHAITIGDENPYLIINQKKSHEDIHFHFFHPSHISLNIIRICWTCNLNCTQPSCGCIAVDVLWMKMKMMKRNGNKYQSHA